MPPMRLPVRDNAGIGIVAAPRRRRPTMGVYLKNTVYNCNSICFAKIPIVGTFHSRFYNNIGSKVFNDLLLF